MICNNLISLQSLAFVVVCSAVVACGDAAKGDGSGSSAASSVRPAASAVSSVASATAPAAAGVPAGGCAACKDGYKDPQGRFCVKLPDGYKVAEEDPNGAGGTQQSVDFAKDGDKKKNSSMTVWFLKDKKIEEVIKDDMHPKDYKVDEDIKLPGGGRAVHSTGKNVDDIEERQSVYAPANGGVVSCEEGRTEAEKPHVAACKSLCAPP